MSKKPCGQKYEKESTMQKRFRRDVLDHLKQHGPTPYDGLYVSFDPCRTGDIGSAIQDLKKSNYIEVGKDQMVKITELGLRLLEDSSYWQ